MNYPLLSIVGTTATGKTDLALAVAEQVLSEGLYSGVALISADSRQVYGDVPLLSGADIPENFIQKKASGEYVYAYHGSNTLPIFLHGVAMLKADQEWSVALFKQFALQIVSVSIQKNYFPIIVGGTGLYHQQLFSGDPHLFVPPNETWRQEAAQLTLEELQEKVRSLSAQKFEALNNSDRNNPRRLQRAIEILMAGTPQVPEWHKKVADQYTQYYIGLSLSPTALAQRIEERVEKRLAQGVITEVTNFLETHTQETLVHSTLGLAQIAKFIHGSLSIAQMKAAWVLEELQYAKRQQVWWKKQPQVTWYGAEQLEGITE